MLRSRLYFGMLPAAGVLIAICLYSIFNYDILSNQLIELQKERIEASASGSIAVHNEKIALIDKQLQQRSSTHFYVVMVGIIVSVVLIGFVSYFLSQRILKPIEALTHSANRLADDEWETDYQPTRSDEIGELEVAFVDMAKRLREYKRFTSDQLVRTRRRMEECFNNFPHPILFINVQREFVYRNPSATDLIDSIGSKGGELHPSIASQVEKVFGTGEEVYSTDFEETISFKVDNQELHFLPIVVRIDNDELDEIECALILQDVTNLRLSDELKSDLVATLSHEIKTPVTSAGMALHLLLEKNLGGLNDDQEDMIRTAAEDLKRLQHLLDHMLQIARLDRRNPKLHTETRAPMDIVQNAIQPHRQIAGGKEITVKQQVESDLPPVRVDPKLIQIALSNFVSNAIKYSEPNSAITVYARKVDTGMVQFGVLDDGPGIPEEGTGRIFDKFYRSSRTPSTDGIGLGLSICKDIVTAHRGLVGCLNRSKCGSDFYFQLPFQ